MVVVAERDAPLSGLICCEGVRVFETFQVAATANFHGDGQFVTVQRLRELAGLGASFGIPGVFLGGFGIDVDEFDDEVAIGAGG